MGFIEDEINDIVLTGNIWYPDALFAVLKFWEVKTTS